MQIELLSNDELRKRACMDTVVFDYEVRFSANDFVKHLQDISYKAYERAFANRVKYSTANVDYEQLFIYRSCQMAIGALKGFIDRGGKLGISLMTDNELEAWSGNDLIVFDYEKRLSANDFVELFLKLSDTVYKRGTAIHPEKAETDEEFEQFYIYQSCRLAIDAFRNFVHECN